MKTYKYKIRKDGEKETISVNADNVAGAEKKLFRMGYSLQFGEWWVDGMEIKKSEEND